MTVATTTTSVTVQGDGLSYTFNYTFPMGGSASYAVLTLTDGGGVTSTITSSLFSITGVTTSTGGTFTYPLSGSAITSGESLELKRVVPLVQNSDIANQGNFYASVVTGALDYEMMAIQQQQTQLDEMQVLIDTLTTSTGSGTVTYVATGSGLSGGPITTTGTITLSTITTGAVLANFSGATAAPQAVTVVAGTGVTLSSTTTSLTISSGTVTSISTGTGLSGGPITTTGTITFSTITNSAMLANFSGATAAPQAVTINAGTGISVTSTTTAITIAATGGGGAGSITLLAQTVLTTSQASVTFSSITSSYQDLEIRVRGRGDAAQTDIGVQAQFNGDTGANYIYADGYLSDTPSGAVANNQTSLRIGNLPAASATTNYSGMSMAIVGNYTGSLFKSYVSVGGFGFNTGANQTLFGGKGGLWRNTASITSITVLPSAGNFTAGSVISLYGCM